MLRVRAIQRRPVEIQVARVAYFNPATVQVRANVRAGKEALELHKAKKRKHEELRNGHLGDRTPEEIRKQRLARLAPNQITEEEAKRQEDHVLATVAAERAQRLAAELERAAAVVAAAGVEDEKQEVGPTWIYTRIKPMTPQGIPALTSTINATVTAVSSGFWDENDHTLRVNADPTWAYTKFYRKRREGKYLLKENNWVIFCSNKYQKVGTRVNRKGETVPKLVKITAKCFLMGRIRSVQRDVNTNATHGWVQQSSTSEFKDKKFEFVYKFDKLVALNITKKDFLAKTDQPNNTLLAPTHLKKIPSDVLALMS